MLISNLQPILLLFFGFLFQKRLQDDNDERNREEQGKQIRTRETSAARVLLTENSLPTNEDTQVRR